MKQLLLNYYGIDLKELNSNLFLYQNQMYYLAQTKLNECDLVMIEHHSINQACRIQINNQHRLISQGYVLYQINTEWMSYQDLVNQSKQIIGYISINQLYKKWLSLIDQIENNYLPRYANNVEIYSVMAYYLSLAETGLDYLKVSSFNLNFPISFQTGFYSKIEKSYISCVKYPCVYLDYWIELYLHEQITLQNFLNYLPAPFIHYALSRMLFNYSLFMGVVNETVQLEEYISLVPIYMHQIKQYYQKVLNYLPDIRIEWLLNYKKL